MSRAQVNNCFFPYPTVFFKNDNWRVYGVRHTFQLSYVHDHEIRQALFDNASWTFQEPMSTLSYRYKFHFSCWAASYCRGGNYNSSIN